MKFDLGLGLIDGPKRELLEESCFSDIEKFTITHVNDLKALDGS